ncbi:MAG TPA: UPF0158 family protein [Pelobium sp.]
MKKPAVKLTDAKLSEACDNLQMGMKVFYNIGSREITSVPDFDEFEMDDEEELWKAETDKVKSDSKNNIELKKMSSHQSFKMMENFAETVDDKTLQRRLFSCLNGKKPFAHFKAAVDNDEVYRQNWFKFRDDAQVEFTKEQIEDRNRFRKLDD